MLFQEYLPPCSISHEKAAHWSPRTCTMVTMGMDVCIGPCQMNTFYFGLTARDPLDEQASEFGFAEEQPSTSHCTAMDYL